MGDTLITTRVSKQAFFDKEKMLIDVDELGEYNIHCFSPSSRWLLATMLAFYGEFHNRFQNFENEREIDQLVAETLLGVICPMACDTDFQALVTAVEGMAATLVEIRDRLGPTDGDLDEKLETVGDNVVLLTAEVADLGFPSLIDKIEAMLNGVGVILGAPPISPNGV